MRLPFFLARRFVAAETLPGALPVLESLSAGGLHTTLDLLGEYISERSLAEASTDEYVGLIETLSSAPASVDRNISIKMSMLGQKIDESFCLDNLHRVLSTARDHDTFVRLDMEGSDVTESTLSLFERVHGEYKGGIGVVLQAYLHRTSDDIDRMCELGARVRLCKGAYREPASIAYQNMGEIRERYLDYMARLLARAPYPAIATHDESLIGATQAHVREQGIEAERFEFQMLYGIRTDTQQRIQKDGFNMRVYVPFGRMWVPYFSRRLRERKENVFFVLRHLFKR